MALINTYEDSALYLSSFSKQGAPVKDLSRFSALAEELGNPQNALKIIHIAGTNGKGSVTEMCARALTECGYKTGRFTSPFIVNLRERITIGGHFISEKDFARLTGVVKDAVERCSDRDFSQFEILTAVCFLYFKEQQTDFCCIEAGIGGTLDCTNIIPCPLAAVITSIGLDHTAILGKTTAEIAFSKSGIIKGGAVVCADGIPKDAMTVLRAHCAETGSVLTVPDSAAVQLISSDIHGSRFMYHGYEYYVSMCGAHQISNCITAAEVLKNIPGLDWTKVRRGLRLASMPARLEIMSESPFVMLDGGHNPQAMQAAAEVLKSDPRRKTALLAMIDTKDYETALKAILPQFDRVFFTDGFMPNAVCAEKLAAVAHALGIRCECVSQAETALSAALAACEDGMLFVGGSLYFAAAMRPLLGGHNE